MDHGPLILLSTPHPSKKKISISKSESGHTAKLVYDPERIIIDVQNISADYQLKKHIERSVVLIHDNEIRSLRPSFPAQRHQLNKIHRSIPFIRYPETR